MNYRDIITIEPGKSQRHNLAFVGLRITVYACARIFGPQACPPDEIRGASRSLSGEDIRLALPSPRIARAGCPLSGRSRSSPHLVISTQRYCARAMIPVLRAPPAFKLLPACPAPAQPPPARLAAAAWQPCHKAFTIGSADCLIRLAKRREANLPAFHGCTSQCGRDETRWLAPSFYRRNKLCEPFCPQPDYIFGRNRWRKGFPIWRWLNGSPMGTKALLKRFIPGIAIGRLSFSSGSRRIELPRRILRRMFSWRSGGVQAASKPGLR